MVILFIAGAVTLGVFRTRGRMERALSLSLFLIMVPRELQKQEGEQQKGMKELIAPMEQLYSVLTHMHTKGWNKFLYGEPYFSLELAVHHVGEEVHFYMAVPKNMETIIEKQIHGVFPAAHVEKVKDYNIFNPNGITVGAYATLKKDSFMPFRTYQNLEVDPLEAILTAFSKLDLEGEGASIQLLARPSHNNEIASLTQKVAKEVQSGNAFKAALRKAKDEKSKTKFIQEVADEFTKKSGETKEEKPEAPKAITPHEEELVKLLQTKASKPLFDVDVRIVVSGPTKDHAERLYKEIEAAFVQYATTDLNEIKLHRVSGGSLDKLVYNYSFRIFDDRKKMTFSTDELTSMYHFPLSTTSAPKVKFLSSKQAEPPPELASDGVVLGRNIFRGRETEIRIGDKDRFRHLYIIGQTGTGKSSIMKKMIRQDIEQGHGACLIDPHGDFAEFVLSVVPKERAEDVIYFNPADKDRPIGLNMLEIDPKDPQQKTFVIDELLKILDKLYNLKETGGPMFEKYFRNALLLLLDDYEHEIPTLADLSRVLTNDKFRADKLSREKDPLVIEFWRDEAEKAGGEASLANIAPYISSKVSTFISNDYLRPILMQKHSSFNFRKVMDEQKILIVNLSKGRIGELSANLLGLLIVGKILLAGFSRVDTPEKERKGFYLYIDEFQNFTTDSIATILSEARKYGISLTIAHQFIKQLAENIRDAVFGNVGSMVVFRISADDAEYMKNKFEPIFSSHDLMNIDNLNAHVNLLINGKTARPFSIQFMYDEGGPKETADTIAELSRLKYGRPREEVEAEIMKR